MADNIYYSFYDYVTDIKRLTRQLRDYQFDLIVGVARGGCIPAIPLSHNLSVPYTSIDFSLRDGVNINPQNVYTFFESVTGRYKNILLVDDLVDSGNSMKQLILVVQNFTSPSVATLLRNVDVDLGVPHFCGTEFSRKKEPRYFDFWWECVNV